MTAIANRSQQSGGWVAEKFGIPRVSTAWREIVESSDVDAVFIGTPPSLHLEVTLAEARTMLGAAPAARARGVRTMLVPPAPWYRGSAFVEHLVKNGFLGQTAAGAEFQHERELRQRADATQRWAERSSAVRALQCHAARFVVRRDAAVDRFSHELRGAARCICAAATADR